MEGIAVGAGIAYEEIVALNVRYEILYYQYAVNKLAAADGCTSFALSPEATENGHLLLGQNWDWIPQVAGAIVHTTDLDGLETLAFTEAGIFGGKIGLNTAGLGLAINGITTTEDDWTRLEKPFHLRCYEILRARSLHDAAKVVTGTPRACSGNFLIAQIPDQAVGLEAAPDTVNRMCWHQQQIVHANHFVDPDALGVTEPPDADHRHRSCRRQVRLEQLLATERPLGMADVQAALRDHNTAPRHICRHEDPDAPVDEQYRTVTSITMDLMAGEIYATDGPPCESEYARFALAQG
jgi:isopenicillin-N N-acyltransferase-like protein